MMHWFARIVLSSQGVAMLVTSALAILSFVLPASNLLSGAAIGLVVLRNGLLEALLTVAGSTVATALLGYFLLQQPFVAAGFLIGVWLPVVGMGYILANSRSMANTLSAGCLVAALLVLGLHVVIGDTTAIWQQWMQQLEPVFQQMPTEADADNLRQALSSVGEIIIGVMTVSLFISAILSLFIARSGQAALFNPGGFQREFHGLRLGSLLLAPALIAGVLSVTLDGMVGQVAKEVFLVFVVTFALQALAVCHAIAKAVRFGGVLLVGIYITLILSLFKLAMVLAAFGVIDHWVDFRSKISSQNA